MCPGTLYYNRDGGEQLSKTHRNTARKQACMSQRRQWQGWLTHCAIVVMREQGHELISSEADLRGRERKREMSSRRTRRGRNEERRTRQRREREPKRPPPNQSSCTTVAPRATGVAPRPL